MRPHRAEVNSLRAFDCKKEALQRVMAPALLIPDCLGDDCSSSITKAAGRVLPRRRRHRSETHALVRGLDYYTRTVFEVQVDSGMA